MLGLVPLFHRVEAAALATLIREAEPRHLEAGEWLFHEGDDADRLYVVLSGRLRIVVTRDGAPNWSGSSGRERLSASWPS